MIPAYVKYNFYTQQCATTPICFKNDATCASIGPPTAHPHSVVPCLSFAETIFRQTDSPHTHTQINTQQTVQYQKTHSDTCLGSGLGSLTVDLILK
jgi:hypothetical protein